MSARGSPWGALSGVGGPWSVADARTALSTGAVGLIIVGWAWWQASGSAFLNDQTGWLTVGILGVIVVLKGLLSWVRTGWRNVGLRRVELLRAFDSTGLAVQTVKTASGGEGEPGADGRYVIVAGMLRYHRDDCLLVRGKSVKQLSQTTRALKDRQACEMCRPGVRNESSEVMSQ